MPSEILSSALLSDGSGLPTLKSCLADDDAATRHMATLLLGDSLALLRGSLDAETGRSLYHEALKRLDDSNDAVRVTACTAIAHLSAAPPDPADAWRGTPVEYILDTLLLHLDDPSQAVQAAVFAALEPWVAVAPAYALKATRAAAGKHRSPVLCQRLLAQLAATEVC